MCGSKRTDAKSGVFLIRVEYNDGAAAFYSPPSCSPSGRVNCRRVNSFLSQTTFQLGGDTAGAANVTFYLQMVIRVMSAGASVTYNTDGVFRAPLGALSVQQLNQNEPGFQGPLI